MSNNLFDKVHFFPKIHSNIRVNYKLYHKYFVFDYIYSRLRLIHERSSGCGPNTWRWEGYIGFCKIKLMAKDTEKRRGREGGTVVMLANPACEISLTLSTCRC